MFCFGNYQHIHSYDKYFMQNSSLTNVVMINGKIRREMNRMDDSIDLLAQRTKDLDDIIKDEENRREQNKKKNEELKDKNALPQYVDLNDFVAELKKVWNFNQKINDKFVNLKSELNKFNELNQLFEKMDDIQSMVNIYMMLIILLDQFIE